MGARWVAPLPIAEVHGPEVLASGPDIGDSHRPPLRAEERLAVPLAALEPARDGQGGAVVSGPPSQVLAHLRPAVPRALEPGERVAAGDVMAPLAVVGHVAGLAAGRFAEPIVHRKRGRR